MKIKQKYARLYSKGSRIVCEFSDKGDVCNFPSLDLAYSFARKVLRELGDIELLAVSRKEIENELLINGVSLKKERNNKDK